MSGYSVSAAPIPFFGSSDYQSPVPQQFQQAAEPSQHAYDPSVYERPGAAALWLPAQPDFSAALPHLAGEGNLEELQQEPSFSHPYSAHGMVQQEYSYQGEQPYQQQQAYSYEADSSHGGFGALGNAWSPSAYVEQTAESFFYSSEEATPQHSAAAAPSQVHPASIPWHNASTGSEVVASAITTTEAAPPVALTPWEQPATAQGMVFPEKAAASTRGRAFAAAEATHFALATSPPFEASPVPTAQQAAMQIPFQSPLPSPVPTAQQAEMQIPFQSPLPSPAKPIPFSPSKQQEAAARTTAAGNSSVLADEASFFDDADVSVDDAEITETDLALDDSLSLALPSCQAALHAPLSDGAAPPLLRAEAPPPTPAGPLPEAAMQRALLQQGSTGAQAGSAMGSSVSSAVPAPNNKKNSSVEAGKRKVHECGGGEGLDGLMSGSQLGSATDVLRHLSLSSCMSCLHVLQLEEFKRRKQAAMSKKLSGGFEAGAMVSPEEQVQHAAQHPPAAEALPASTEAPLPSHPTPSPVGTIEPPAASFQWQQQPTSQQPQQAQQDSGAAFPSPHFPDKGPSPLMQPLQQPPFVTSATAAGGYSDLADRLASSETAAAALRAQLNEAHAVRVGGLA
jgi:hypothetical protein